MSRYIDADKLYKDMQWNIQHDMYDKPFDYLAEIECQPTADVRDDATAHKVVGGGERDGATCWFECDNCGLAVDVSDVFCKHCGARFVP